MDASHKLQEVSHPPRPNPLREREVDHDHCSRGGAVEVASLWPESRTSGAAAQERPERPQPAVQPALPDTVWLKPSAPTTYPRFGLGRPSRTLSQQSTTIKLSTVSPTPGVMEFGRDQVKRPRSASAQMLVVASEQARGEAARLHHALALMGFLVADFVGHTTFDNLRATLKESSSHLVLLHLDQFDEVELRELLNIRRMFSTTDWVLTWSRPPARCGDCVDCVIRLRIKGCVDFGDPKMASKALEAILAGEFWFPRAIANGLYLTLQRTLLAAPSLEPAHGDGSSADLSPREAASLELLRQGLSNKEIARRLEVSINTVKKHLKNAYDKRGIHSRRQFVG